MKLFIRSIAMAVLVFLTTVQAQQKATGFIALPDSGLLLLHRKQRIDTLKTKPRLILKIPAGKQRLQLIFPNDRAWNDWAVDTTLNIPVADTLFLHNLRRAQNFGIRFSTISLSANARQRLPLKHWLRPGLAALTVLTNWGSFYLKRRADDYYRAYRHTSDLHKIHYYFRQTRNFDAYSNALLSVSVASLGGFLYLLLTSP